eukprot:5118347-Pyramimonas_sp.AAC.1
MAFRQSAFLPPVFLEKVSKRDLASTAEPPSVARWISHLSGRATAKGTSSRRQSGPPTSP